MICYLVPVVATEDVYHISVLACDVWMYMEEWHQLHFLCHEKYHKMLTLGSRGRPWWTALISQTTLNRHKPVYMKTNSAHARIYYVIISKYLFWKVHIQKMTTVKEPTSMHAMWYFVSLQKNKPTFISRDQSDCTNWDVKWMTIGTYH